MNNSNTARLSRIATMMALVAGTTYPTIVHPTPHPQPPAPPPPPAQPAPPAPVPQPAPAPTPAAPAPVVVPPPTINNNPTNDNALTQEQQQEQQQQQQQEQRNLQQQGDQNVYFNSQYRRQTPQVGTIQLVGGGACPEGWGLGFSTPGLGGTFAKTNQSIVCLSQNAATSMLNAGVASGDGLIIAGGLRALANIHFEIDYAIDTVYRNTMKECSAKALNISPLLMARRGKAEVDAEGKIIGYEAGIDCTEINKIYANFFPRRSSATATALATPGTERQVIINNNNYIFLDEAKKKAGEALTGSNKGGEKAGAKGSKDPCVNVRIPQAASRTACVDPALAAKNKSIWEIIDPKPTPKVDSSVKASIPSAPAPGASR